MISDKERRRAATELREASTGAYRHVDSLDVIAGAVGVEIDGKFSHEVENETFAALVDFIDRPTCRNVSGYRDVFKCSECGVELELISAVCNEYGEEFHVPFQPHFCPNCGAVIVDED